jgi:hypothetical protein
MTACSSSIARLAVAATVVAGVSGCAASEPSTAAAAARRQHALAVAHAADYCRQKGMAMRASPADAPTHPGQASSDFQFRCVKAR